MYHIYVDNAFRTLEFKNDSIEPTLDMFGVMIVTIGIELHLTILSYIPSISII